MTDIETLRQAVIDAALEYKEHGTGDSHFNLINAVDALDAAMRPDPWALLEAVAQDDIEPGTWTRVEAALAWRKEHPDE